MQQFIETARTKLETIYGDFDFSCYSWGEHDEDNILCISNIISNENVIVRVQCACYSGEIFRSKDCDCHEQLVASLERIYKDGGIIIYMLSDGRGAGSLNKIKGMELSRTKGLDTVEAYKELNLKVDFRVYDKVAPILNHLNIQSIQLLTNNPKKVEEIRRLGIQVTRVELEIQATEYSKAYLKTKMDKMGHIFKQFK